MASVPTSRRRRAAGRSARPRRGGYTLIETMIAVLLISVVVTSVFSLVLTARVAEKKSSRRAQAVFYVRRATEALRPYVTADLNMPGPMAGWHMSGDTNAGWALANGGHNLDAWLPKTNANDFCAIDPANCHLTYTVTPLPNTPPGCITATSCAKQVDFAITWKEPQP